MKLVALIATFYSFSTLGHFPFFEKSNYDLENAEVFKGCSFETTSANPFSKNACRNNFQAWSNAMTDCHHAGYDRCKTVNYSCKDQNFAKFVCVYVRGVR